MSHVGVCRYYVSVSSGRTGFDLIWLPDSDCVKRVFAGGSRTIAWTINRNSSWQWHRSDENSLSRKPWLELNVRNSEISVTILERRFQEGSRVFSCPNTFNTQCKNVLKQVCVSYCRVHENRTTVGLVSQLFFPNYKVGFIGRNKNLCYCVLTYKQSLLPILFSKALWINRREPSLRMYSRAWNVWVCCKNGE